MPLFDVFKEAVNQQALFPAHAHLFVAVSGGGDSVALLDCLHHFGYACTVVHVNFQLRGAESDADEHFVRQLAQRLGFACLTKTVDTRAAADAAGTSVETTARDLRYAWFSELLEAHSQASPHVPAFLVTAHHADDQVETVLHRLVRGTGLRGLLGIPQRNGQIVRPFLQVRKAEILAHLLDRELSWREDASNVDTQFTRNFLRQDVIPALSDRFPQWPDRLLENVRIWQETLEIFDEAIEHRRRKLREVLPNSVERYPVIPLTSLTPRQTWLWELFRGYGLEPAQLPTLAALLQAETGKQMITPTHRIMRNRRWLEAVPHHLTEQPHWVVDSVPFNVILPGANFKVEALALPANDIRQTPPEMAWMDARDLAFPLLIRRWKPADYFYPLGLNKKKKLSRFFIDLKLALWQKEQIWVVESQGRIVWVAGHRLDHRFRIRPDSTNVLRMTLTPTK